MVPLCARQRYRMLEEENLNDTVPSLRSNSILVLFGLQISGCHIGLLMAAVRGEQISGNIREKSDRVQGKAQYPSLWHPEADCGSAVASGPPQWDSGGSTPVWMPLGPLCLLPPSCGS